MRRSLPIALAAIAVIVVALLVVLRSHDVVPTSGAPTPRATAQPSELRADEPASVASTRAEPLAEAAAPSSKPAAAPGSSQLTVRVVDETGRAVPERRVSLTFLSDTDVQIGVGDHGQTNADGECVLDVRKVQGQPGPVLAVAVDPPKGYVARRWRAPAGTPRLEIALTRAGRFWGRVAYSDASIPTSEAWLYVYWRQDDGTLVQANTEVVDGAFDFGVALAGRIESVELDCPGKSYGRLDVPDFDVAPATDVRRDFVFDLGTTLELSFVDKATRAPIAGVRTIGLQRDDEAANELGRLVLANVLCARCEVRLRIVHADYQPRQVDLVGPEVSHTLPLEIELERGLELGGVVTDPRGTPQVGLRVSCERSVRPRTGSGRAMTNFHVHTTSDEHGRFRLRGIPSRGAVEVSFERPADELAHRAGALVAFELVTLPEAAAREIWVVPDPVSIIGEVLDSRDERVAGLDVLAIAAYADLRRVETTDELGRFRIDDALPGAWILTATHGSRVQLADYTVQVTQRSSMSIDVTPVGSTRVSFRLAASRDAWATRMVRMSFVDAATSAPLAKVEWMQLSGVDNSFARDWSRWRSAEKVLELELAVGRYEIAAGDPQHRMSQQFVDVGLGDGAQLLEIRVASGD